MIGRRSDAETLGYEHTADATKAASAVAAGLGAVVPSEQVAVETLRILDAPEEWIATHVMADWAIEPPDQNS